MDDRFLQHIERIFDEKGILSEKLPGFEYRASQRDMAVHIADAVSSPSHLILEAGTGTGKTLAYLIPALFSGKQVIISTGTKNLQEQIYGKDLPKSSVIFCFGRSQGGLLGNLALLSAWLPRIHHVRFFRMI